MTAALAVGTQPIDYAPYNGYSIYWLSLVGGFIALFLPVELHAMASGHPENTLSAQFWRIGDVVAGQPIAQWSAEHWWMAIVVGLLFSWLIVHFDFGLLR